MSNRLFLRRFASIALCAFVAAACTSSGTTRTSVGVSYYGGYGYGPHYRYPGYWYPAGPPRPPVRPPPGRPPPVHLPARPRPR